MKAIIFSLLVLFAFSATSFAQAPEAIKYQAAVRDADGNRLKNSAIGVQISIVQDSATGSAVYTETFAETTSGSGLLNIELGTGTPTTGTFSAIDWSQGPYFVELALDITGGTSYQVMGSTQLVSVPYALYANTSERSQIVNKADRDAMTNVSTGTIIYCSDCGTNGELQVFNSTEWTNLVGDPVVE